MYLKYLCPFLVPLLQLGNGDFILNSPVITNFGRWENNWQTCPTGTFVKAIDVSFPPNIVEPVPPPDDDKPDTIDNTGLTAIAIECASLSDAVDHPGTVRTTGSGGNFNAPLPTACDGFAIGFQLLSDDPQIALDNTGANNVRIYCSGLRDSATQYAEGEGEYTGTWTDPQFCKDRQAICGIKSQIQTSGADKTGINNVRIKCCDIPSPASTCTPNERWELTQECDNLNGKLPIACTFYRSVGIGTTTNFETPTGGKSLTEEYYQNSALGFRINSESGDPQMWLINDLSKKFATELGDSLDTGHNWTVVGTETWAPESSTVVHFDVQDGYRAEIYQLVGSCSYFSVKTPRIKKLDKDKFGQVSVNK